MTVNDRWPLSGCGVLQTNYPGGLLCAWLHVKVFDDGQKNGIYFLRGLAVIGSMLWQFLLSSRFSRWLLFSRMIGWFRMPIVCDSDYAWSASLLCMMSRSVFAFRWMSTQLFVWFQFWTFWTYELSPFMQDELKFACFAMQPVCIQ